MASSNTPIPVDDGFNEYESAVKRQKSTTSKVWDEMTKLECENKNELKAQCNHYPESSNTKLDRGKKKFGISRFLFTNKYRVLRAQRSDLVRDVSHYQPKDLDFFQHRMQLS
ncbi:hypothetical protein V6Z11_D01G193600 [Gossypium hirsutum]